MWSFGSGSFCPNPLCLYSFLWFVTFITRRAHIMPSVQFQKDKSDSGGIILHSIVIKMITRRNYINIQDSPTLPEKKSTSLSQFFLWLRGHMINYSRWKFSSKNSLGQVEMHIIKNSLCAQITKVTNYFFLCILLKIIYSYYATLRKYSPAKIKLPIILYPH